MTPVAAGRAALTRSAAPGANLESPPHRDHRDSPGGYTAADLPTEPASARRARRLTRAALTRWHLAHLADDAETIATELAANAINAATPPTANRPAIILAIHHRPGELKILIWDNGPGTPQRKTPGPNAENGRGLAIVSELSRAWGWWPTPRSGGKVTWAALATTPSADDGPC